MTPSKILESAYKEGLFKELIQVSNKNEAQLCASKNVDRLIKGYAYDKSVVSEIIALFVDILFPKEINTSTNPKQTGRSVPELAIPSQPKQNEGTVPNHSPRKPLSKPAKPQSGRGQSGHASSQPIPPSKGNKPSAKKQDPNIVAGGIGLILLSFAGLIASVCFCGFFDQGDGTATLLIFLLLAVQFFTIIRPIRYFYKNKLLGINGISSAIAVFAGLIDFAVPFLEFEPFTTILDFWFGIDQHFEGHGTLFLIFSTLSATIGLILAIGFFIESFKDKQLKKSQSFGIAFIVTGLSLLILLCVFASIPQSYKYKGLDKAQFNVYYNHLLSNDLKKQREDTIKALGFMGLQLDDNINDMESWIKLNSPKEVTYKTSIVSDDKLLNKYKPIIDSVILVTMKWDNQKVDVKVSVSNGKVGAIDINVGANFYSMNPSSNDSVLSLYQNKYGEPEVTIDSLQIQNAASHHSSYHEKYLFSEEIIKDLTSEYKWTYKNGRIVLSRDMLNNKYVYVNRITYISSLLDKLLDAHNDKVSEIRRKEQMEIEAAQRKSLEEARKQREIEREKAKENHQKSMEEI